MGCLGTTEQFFKVILAEAAAMLECHSCAWYLAGCRKAGLSWDNAAQLGLPLFSLGPLPLTVFSTWPLSSAGLSLPLKISPPPTPPSIKAHNWNWLLLLIVLGKGNEDLTQITCGRGLQKAGMGGSLEDILETGYHSIVFSTLCPECVAMI